MRFPSLLLFLNLASTTVAQVPAGHLVVLHETPAGSALTLIEPLRGVVTPLNLPAGRPWRRAAVGGPGPGLLLVTTGQTAQEEQLFFVPLVSGVLGTPQVFGGTYPGRITGLVPTGAGIFVATSLGAFRLTTSGGNPTQIETLPIVAASHGPDEVALITAQSGPTGPTYALVRHDLRTQARTATRLNITPVALSHALAEDGYVVAQEDGSLFVVQAATGALRFITSARTSPVQSLAFDPYRRRHLVGVPGAIIECTPQGVQGGWPLTGSTNTASIDLAPYQSSVRRYGNGCSATPVHIASLLDPFPGNGAFALIGAPCPPGAAAILMVGGFATQVDLSALGMAGCSLLTQPVIQLPTVAGANGRILLPLPVPPMPGLVGGAVFVQFAVVDATANRFGLVTSDGARLGF